MPIMDEFAQEPDKKYIIYRTGAWSEPKHDGGDCTDNEDFLIDQLRDGNKADRDEADALKAKADKEISDLKVAFDAS